MNYLKNSLYSFFYNLRSLINIFIYDTIQFLHALLDMDTKLLDIIACPLCKSKLKYIKNKQELLCTFDRLAFEIRDDIPVMLVDEARHVELEELE